ncbi:Uncharacterized protein FWK35_00030831, partial [Aphis craccivora]
MIGIVLVHLFIKAICLLEGIGAIINGVVSDGASTNRKLWAKLGVSGQKGQVKKYFEHPLKNNRKVYMFSDAPHLIKNVRNKLYNKKSLRVTRNLNSPTKVCPKITPRHIAPDNFAKMSVKLATQVLEDTIAWLDSREDQQFFGTVRQAIGPNDHQLCTPTFLQPFIRWSHYVDVYMNDIARNSNSPTKVCPKITPRHIAPDNFAKMSVKLATQIFSDSMAKGIQFYRQYIKIDSLKNSYETQTFTERLNLLFDVLNRKYPAEGIKKNSNDFKVLEDTIAWLDSWEDQVDQHGITGDEFLTQSTAEGLRVTIQSTLDLCKYLLDECGFKYILTYKMNQDRLEQFFGTVRQAIGPNDHPCTPTFLQVYKMLAVYSILKPPKSGNCSILNPETPKITISDLKTIFNTNDITEKEKKIEHLRKTLDS